MSKRNKEKTRPPTQTLSLGEYKCDGCGLIICIPLDANRTDYCPDCGANDSLEYLKSVKAVIS
jgi:hypothetical protein